LPADFDKVGLQDQLLDQFVDCIIELEQSLEAFEPELASHGNTHLSLGYQA
jgi:hypothetical protein